MKTIVLVLAALWIGAGTTGCEGTGMASTPSEGVSSDALGTEACNCQQPPVDEVEMALSKASYANIEDAKLRVWSEGTTAAFLRQRLQTAGTLNTLQKLWVNNTNHRVLLAVNALYDTQFASAINDANYRTVPDPGFIMAVNLSFDDVVIPAAGSIQLTQAQQTKLQHGVACKTAETTFISLKPNDYVWVYAANPWLLAGTITTTFIVNASYLVLE